MQQHSKEAAELLYMIFPLSTQMENMQNNTKVNIFCTYVSWINVGVFD